MRFSAFIVLSLAGAATCLAADSPETNDPGLERGRAVWLGTCAACHGNSMSDAPQAKDKAAWAIRLTKGLNALYASALNGRIGPEGTEMPPRGGNAALFDTEVKAAVNYMISIAVN